MDSRKTTWFIKQNKFSAKVDFASDVAATIQCGKPIESATGKRDPRVEHAARFSPIHWEFDCTAAAIALRLRLH